MWRAKFLQVLLFWRGGGEIKIAVGDWYIWMRWIKFVLHDMEIKPSVTKYLLFTKAKLCLYLFQCAEERQYLHVSQRDEVVSGQRTIRGSLSYKTTLCYSYTKGERRFE